jgi:uncharacterized protein YutE (UPF0331/DUF86 family)
MLIFGISFSESQVLDRNRIAKDIADIAMARGEIERLIAVDQATFFSDSRNVFSVRYLIIQTVEAMTDICQHMLARARGIPCDGYIDCIVKAGEHGIISVALTERLRRLAALRNILVHRYWSIDDARVYIETKANVSDLTTFIDEIEALVRALP